MYVPMCLQLGSPQQKPKRLRVLADVSGSMYRFNGVDGRLERSMEAVCMVMEALESYEHKFKVRNIKHQSGKKEICVFGIVSREELAIFFISTTHILSSAAHPTNAYSLQMWQHFHPIYFILGMYITEDNRKCRVKFGAFGHIKCSMLINFE